MTTWTVMTPHTPPPPTTWAEPVSISLEEPCCTDSIWSCFRFTVQTEARLPAPGSDPTRWPPLGSRPGSELDWHITDRHLTEHPAATWNQLSWTDGTWNFLNKIRLTRIWPCKIKRRNISVVARQLIQIPEWIQRQCVDLWASDVLILLGRRQFLCLYSADQPSTGPPARPRPGEQVLVPARSPSTTVCLLLHQGPSSFSSASFLNTNHLNTRNQVMIQQLVTRHWATFPRKIQF